MRELLKDYDIDKVNVFVAYLNELKTEKDKDGKSKNWWLSKINKTDLAGAFIKVASTGLFIDGDTVTLTFRKQLVITYDYHAYQNKILMTYPDTKFDFGLVHNGDEFTYRKESGEVIYTHKVGNPFANSSEIIGAYGVIKNSKGEFIETINKSDIEKMKKSSMMAYIWNTWYDRMVLKSVIKRLCAVHFKDIVKDIDSTDNETNEPIRAELDEDILSKIDNATTQAELSEIYATKLSKASNKKAFIEILGKRKKEILKND